MSDKIRGVIAILVGIFAIYQGYARYHAGHTDWKPILEIVAGTLLIGIGLWRVQRRPDDPSAELLP